MKFVKKWNGYYSEDNKYKVVRHYATGGYVARWAGYRIVGEDERPTDMFGDENNDFICCCKTLKEALVRMERVPA